MDDEYVEDVTQLVGRERASLVIVDAGSAAWRAGHALQEVPEFASTAVLLLPSIPAPTGDESEQLTRAVSTAARETGEPNVDTSQSVDVLVVDDDPAERQFLSRSAVRVLQKGEHRLADVAALVLRAAIRAAQGLADGPLVPNDENEAPRSSAPETVSR